MRQRATFHGHTKAHGCCMHGGSWVLQLVQSGHGSHQCYRIINLQCLFLAFFSPIAHIAVYRPNTFDFLNLAWSMIPVMEEKPVSVLTQKWRLCLFDDSVETGCSQRRQPQTTEVGPAGQQTRTGPPRSAGDGGDPASLTYRVQLARYLHITTLGFGGWLAVADALPLATTFSQSPMLSWRY